MASIVLLSGAIASGKTTLAEELTSRHGFRRLKSSDHLKAICAEKGVEITRANLQKVGDDLDLDTDFKWLISDIAAPQIASTPDQQRWLVDAVRKERQVEHFREAFGSQVLHAHIWAPDEVLKVRYNQRRLAADQEGPTTYAEAVAHPNEAASRALHDKADVSMNVHRISVVAAADAIAAFVS
jgi:adenylosuccinate synthase